MNYTYGRYLAVKSLSDSDLAELHTRENKIQFALPFFNIKALFPKSFNNIPEKMEVTESQCESFRSHAYKHMPPFKNYQHPKDKDYHPDMTDLQFVHDFDMKLRYVSISV